MFTSRPARLLLLLPTTPLFLSAALLLLALPVLIPAPPAVVLRADRGHKNEESDQRHHSLREESRPFRHHYPPT